MKCELPALLNLPQEICDEIYKYVLLEDEVTQLQPVSEPTVKPNPNLPPGETRAWIIPRRQANLSAVALGDSPDIYLSTLASLGQVSKQLRLEVAYFLESCCEKLPTVARVHNFDFDQVIRYLSAPSTRSRLHGHTLHENGTVAHKLTSELDGPYDKDWRRNLPRWIDHLDEMLPTPGAEFGALHKMVPYHIRRLARAPIEIGFCVLVMHERWRFGPGRLELEKIRNTVSDTGVRSVCSNGTRPCLRKRSRCVSISTRERPL